MKALVVLCAVAVIAGNAELIAQLSKEEIKRRADAAGGFEFIDTNRLLKK